MYKVAKVILDKLEIKGYEITDDSESKIVSVAEIIKLAEKDEIEGITVVQDTICFKNGMQGISWDTQYSNKEFTLLSRMMNKDNNCIGYKVKDEKGKELRLSLNKAWELAALHKISGIEAKVMSGVKTIIGNGDLRLSDVAKEMC